MNFNLKLTYREGGHHSGNWGGLLANPGIVMAHALATITDERGQIKVPEWRPKTLDQLGARRACRRPYRRRRERAQDRRGLGREGR